MEKDSKISSRLIKGLLFVFCCVSFFADPIIFAKNNNADAKGRLKITGDHVLQVQLTEKDGPAHQVNNTNKIIELPPGQYNCPHIQLEGGFQCRYNADMGWITIDPNKTTELKIGAPLIQNLDIKRRGNVMILSYSLVGVGGEKYIPNDLTKPPAFTVYKGDKQIAAGKFEFG